MSNTRQSYKQGPKRYEKDLKSRNKALNGTYLAKWIAFSTESYRANREQSWAQPPSWSNPLALDFVCGWFVVHTMDEVNSLLAEGPYEYIIVHPE